MEEYKSNSNKYRQEQKSDIPEKVIEKVIKGDVKVRPKSTLRQIADTFIATDLDEIITYVRKEVIVPKLKVILEESVNSAIHLSLWEGNSKSQNAGVTKSTLNGGRNYAWKNRNTTNSGTKAESVMRSRRELTDLVFETESDILEIIDKMNDVLDKYPAVSVRELYEMLVEKDETDDSLLTALPESMWTTSNFGWETTSGFKWKRIPEGWLLNVPRAIDIR